MTDSSIGRYLRHAREGSCSALRCFLAPNTVPPESLSFFAKREHQAVVRRLRTGLGR